MDRNALNFVGHVLQSCRNMFETPAADLLNSFNESYILCHTQILYSKDDELLEDIIFPFNVKSGLHTNICPVPRQATLLCI
jgi:hypothetical protein